MHFLTQIFHLVYFCPFLVGDWSIFFFTSKKCACPILFFIDVESIRKLRWVPFLTMTFIFFLFNFQFSVASSRDFLCLQGEKSMEYYMVEKNGYESRPRHRDGMTCKKYQNFIVAFGLILFFLSGDALLMALIFRGPPTFQFPKVKSHSIKITLMNFLWEWTTW